MIQLAIISLCAVLPMIARADSLSMSDHAQTADQVAIERLLASLDEAWARGDADAFASHFAADGTFTNILGTFFSGHQAFRDRHEAIFRTVFKGSTQALKLEKLRFIRSDVAIADIDATVRGYAALPAGVSATPDGTLRTKLLLVLIKERGEWWITAFHNVPVAPSAPKS
jgi:uncharacterized protein (TIGR02246 family)